MSDDFEGRTPRPDDLPPDDRAADTPDVEPLDDLPPELVGDFEADDDGPVLSQTIHELIEDDEAVPSDDVYPLGEDTSVTDRFAAAVEVAQQDQDVGELDDPDEANPYASLSAFDPDGVLGPEDQEFGSPPEDTPPAPMSEDERLRQPRAQGFRRRLRSQISTLPLALFLLLMGAFLLAREQDVSGLPNPSDRALFEISALALGFSLLFHGLLSGRRERGLLFLGLWVFTTGGLIGGLLLGVEDQPDVTTWWPLLLWSLSLALLFTYLLERTHDARLVLLSLMVFLAGVTAYTVTDGRVSDDVLDLAKDYWPLLLSVLGLVFLPLAFRRRAG